MDRKSRLGCPSAGWLLRKPLMSPYIQL